MTTFKPPAPSEVKPKRLPGMQRARLSREMRAVLEAMVEKGLPIRRAAEQVGMHPNSAVRAFQRPHVKALYRQMVTEVRNNTAMEAFCRIRDMSVDAASEPTRLDANKWLAGIDGLSPVKRIAGQYVHSHHFGGFEYGRGGISGWEGESGDEIDG